MVDFYLHYLSEFHYVGFFVLLLLCGMGLPIPEDLIIVLGGYLIHLGQVKLWPTLILLYCGAISGDICLYWIGRRFGKEILEHKRLTWLLTPNRIKAINHYFHHYGNRTLFFARFMVGLRSTIFLSSGAFKIPFRKVLLFNGTAASISVPLVTFLGYRFGSHLDSLVFWMKRAEHILLFVAGIGLGILIVLFRHHLKQKEKEFEKESSEFDVPQEVIQD